ncbi:hypothetical protein E2C01_086713 [Portunus trituberculatus]|uniref:Uncharacterized protein n=1 Tax=Portunus trituberculatus TaxID=210409 RepID=A0A5B7J1K3_PORTR|nr:hypothetical protein [Portunus trituberculatus]
MRASAWRPACTELDGGGTTGKARHEKHRSVLPAWSLGVRGIAPSQTHVQCTVERDKRNRVAVALFVLTRSPRRLLRRESYLGEA